MDLKNTGERIKAYLEMKDLKIADIIRAAEPYTDLTNIKLNSSDISRYISGNYQPAQSKLHILALAMDVSEAWLMGFDVPMERTDGMFIDGIDTQTEILIRLISQLDTDDRINVKNYIQNVLLVNPKYDKDKIK